MSRLAVQLVLVSIITASCSAAADQPAPRSAAIQLRNPSTHVTEGELVVTAEPDVVYATLVDYAHWTNVFTYLNTVNITSQRGDRAEIVTISKKGNKSTLRFNNDRTKRLVRFDQLGGRADAKAQIAISPGKAAGTTVVQVRLDAQVSGPAGWFVSDSQVRAKREKKIAKDLGQLEAYFRKPATASTK